MINEYSPDIVSDLIKRITILEKENASLRQKVLELEAKLAASPKNSRNSSKPPSSDITKPRFRHPELEPTNNPAEQAIHFVILDRAVTQRTRSEAGRGWSQRAWTVSTTCSMRKYSLFNLLRHAIHSFYAQTKPPSSLLQI
ncbi:MAG: DUF6444 domain-containing protein [Deltaproteobacteria bacterium]|nr:DUF6444 domain-containing protein [Deltaproteobacteria bacterium]